MGLPAIKDDVVPAPAYDVGYARPPVHARFQPGTSGNPRGRPRGAKSKRPRMNERRFNQVVLEEAYKTLTIQEDGRPINITIAQGVMRSIGRSAIKGHARAQRLFTDVVRATETQNMADYQGYVDVMTEYKIEGEKWLDAYRRARIPAPEMIPHPSDIVTDPETHEVIVRGPINKEQFAVWQERASARDGARDLMTYCVTELETCEDEERQRLMQKVLAQAVKTERLATKAVGEWPKHWPKWETDEADDNEPDEPDYSTRVNGFGPTSICR